MAGRGRECSKALLSEFRDRVIQLLPRIEKGEWPEPRSARGRKTVLFLYNARMEANEADSEPRRALRRLENDFEVKRIGGPTDETDGVLVYQQEAGDRWFENKLDAVKDMRRVKAAWPVPPPDKGTAKKIASDFKFLPAPEFDTNRKRLLLTGAEPDPLETFIEFVNRSPERDRQPISRPSRLRERRRPLVFRREKQVREVVALLALHRFLAVVGVPGSGKSSLVKAGLCRHCTSAPWEKSFQTGAWR